MTNEQMTFWGFVASILSLLLAIPGVWLVFRPKLADWWAARSARSLRRQIHELEELLKVQPVTALEVSIFAWEQLFRIVTVAVYGTLPLLYAALRPVFSNIVTDLVPIPSVALQHSAVFLFAFWFFIMVLWTLPAVIAITAIRHLRMVRTPSGREQYARRLEERIVNLRQTLAVKAWELPPDKI